jgi:hypothetical protein
MWENFVLLVKKQKEIRNLHKWLEQIRMSTVPFGAGIFF